MRKIDKSHMINLIDKNLIRKLEKKIQNSFLVKYKISSVIDPNNNDSIEDDTQEIQNKGLKTVFYEFIMKIG